MINKNNSTVKINEKDKKEEKFDASNENVDSDDEKFLENVQKGYKGSNMSTVQDAKIEVCKNIKLIEMLSGNTKNKFSSNLYTMNFEVVIKNFPKEFGDFLKTVYNDKEW
jgi:hypothetical protein